MSLALAGAILLAAMLVLTHNRRSPGALEPRPRLLTTLHSRCFMAGSKSTLTAARLRELLHYDPDTGIFTWKICRTGRAVAGSIAGSPSNGYIAICVDGCVYKAHRLAFMYVNGKLPEFEVDHINGVKNDNSYSNLRDCKHDTNAQNIRSARVDNNSSGVLGVSWHKKNGKWRAQIQVSGKKYHIGDFGTIEEARSAYLGAKRLLHVGCTI